MKSFFQLGSLYHENNSRVHSRGLYSHHKFWLWQQRKYSVSHFTRYRNSSLTFLVQEKMYTLKTNFDSYCSLQHNNSRSLSPSQFQLKTNCDNVCLQWGKSKMFMLATCVSSLVVNKSTERIAYFMNKSQHHNQTTIYHTQLLNLFPFLFQNSNTKMALWTVGQLGITFASLRMIAVLL